jgi:hypothetical protein
MSFPFKDYEPLIEKHASWALKLIAWISAIAVLVILMCLIVVGPPMAYRTVRDALWPPVRVAVPSKGKPLPPPVPSDTITIHGSNGGNACQGHANCEQKPKEP